MAHQISEKESGEAAPISEIAEEIYDGGEQRCA